MNLGQLTTQFTKLANRRDLSADTALQTVFINQGIMRIQRDLRVPAMEKSLNITVGAGYSGIIIPNDLLELIQIIPATTNERLRKCDISRALHLAQTVGDPTEYARQGGVWVLGNAPAVGAVIRVDYYAELPSLVNSTDTNVIGDIAWDMVVYAALVEAGVYYTDKRLQTWEDKYQGVLAALQAQADEDDLNGGSEVMPCYSFPVEWTDLS